jgi:hypothetical protein
MFTGKSPHSYSPDLADHATNFVEDALFLVRGSASTL